MEPTPNQSQPPKLPLKLSLPSQRDWLTGDLLKLATEADDRTANKLDVLDWVFNNVATDPKAIDPATVPSKGAVALLKFAKENIANYARFLDMWTKTLPTKSELDAAGRFNDDGRKQLNLMDQFEQSLEASPEAAQ